MSMYVMSSDCSRTLLDAEGVAELLCDCAIFPDDCPEGFVRFSVASDLEPEGSFAVFTVTIGEGDEVVPVGSTIDECLSVVISATEGK